MEKEGTAGKVRNESLIRREYLTNTVLLVLILLSVIILAACFSGIVKNNLSIENINDKTEININENDILNDKNVNNVRAEEDLGTSGASEDILFVLGEHEGKLTIFNRDRSIIYETFDVYIDTLPAYDREVLSKGIAIFDTEELYALIEDFTS